MNFQEIVVLIASIILIIMLIIIGFSLARNRKDQTFPPVLSECPDFWVSGDDGCTNPKNLGICGKGPIDFSKNQYKGHNGNCNRAKWARDCHVTWAGITNNQEFKKCR